MLGYHIVKRAVNTMVIGSERNISYKADCLVSLLSSRLLSPV